MQPSSSRMALCGLGFHTAKDSTFLTAEKAAAAVPDSKACTSCCLVRPMATARSREMSLSTMLMESAATMSASAALKQLFLVRRWRTGQHQRGRLGH